MKRISQFSGSWYNGTEKELKGQIERCSSSQFGIHKFKSPQISSDFDLIGIISPHAGYEYSGPTATIGFYHLQKLRKNENEIIIIGPDHRGASLGITLYPAGSWQTPLGEISSDTQISALWQQFPWRSLSAKIDDKTHGNEHSLEMQVPMMQHFLDPLPMISPIMMSDQSLEIASILSDFIIDYFQRRKEIIPIVASSDFSHETNYDQLLKNDKQYEEIILTGNAKKVNEERLKHKITSCGYGPINTLLFVASKYADIQSKSVKIYPLSRTNSGIVKNQKSGYTVGYASILVGIV
jgi:MEMO1 family protein